MLVAAGFEFELRQLFGFVRLLAFDAEIVGTQ